jgi:hypothetical protein
VVHAGLGVEELASAVVAAVHLAPLHPAVLVAAVLARLVPAGLNVVAPYVALADALADALDVALDVPGHPVDAAPAFAAQLVGIVLLVVDILALFALSSLPVGGPLAAAAPSAADVDVELLVAAVLAAACELVGHIFPTAALGIGRRYG